MADISEIRASIKGRMREATKVFRGQTGIFGILAREHGEVSSLLEQAIRTSSDQKRRELAEMIRIELLSHSKAEEQTFYSALKAFAETRGLAEHSQEEHEEIATRIRQAVWDNGGPEQQRANLERLRDLVEHHVETEEGDIFSRAQRLMPPEKSKLLAERFEELKLAEVERLSAEGVARPQTRERTTSDLSHH